MEELIMGREGVCSTLVIGGGRGQRVLLPLRLGRVPQRPRLLLELLDEVSLPLELLLTTHSRSRIVLLPLLIPLLLTI